MPLPCRRERRLLHGEVSSQSALALGKHCVCRDEDIRDGHVRRNLACRGNKNQRNRHPTGPGRVQRHGRCGGGQKRRMLGVHRNRHRSRRCARGFQDPCVSVLVAGLVTNTGDRALGVAAWNRRFAGLLSAGTTRQQNRACHHTALRIARRKFWCYPQGVKRIASRGSDYRLRKRTANTTFCLDRYEEYLYIDYLDIAGQFIQTRGMKTLPSQGTDLLQGTLDLLVLRTLIFGPLHGYGIAKAIHQTSNEALRIEFGSLYPALRRLDLKGWIASRWETSERNRKAKFYRLTPAGKRQLVKEESKWQQFVAAMSGVLKSDPRVSQP